MFTKIHTKVRIYGNLMYEVPYWVIDKKIISESNRKLPNEFNIIQLNTPNNLNKNKEWK